MDSTASLESSITNLSLAAPKAEAYDIYLSFCNS